MISCSWCRLLAGLSIFHQRQRLVALEDPQRRISEEYPSPFPSILASAYSQATTMAASSSLSFRPFFSSVTTDSKYVVSASTSVLAFVF